MIHSKEIIAEKRSEYATRYKPIVFNDDNVWSHIVVHVKNYLEKNEREVLVQPLIAQSSNFLTAICFDSGRPSRLATLLGLSAFLAEMISLLLGRTISKRTLW